MSTKVMGHLRLDKVDMLSCDQQRGKIGEGQLPSPILDTFTQQIRRRIFEM
jgi:hypothetical protein